MGPPLSFALPAVEPFPLDIYPDAVRRLVRCGANSIGCPADIPALAILAVAGAAIGRSASLLLKPGYLAHPSFYVVCVGKPGDGKSPAVAMVVKPMIRIDEENFTSWLEARRAYESEETAFGAVTKSSRRALPKRGRDDDLDESDDREMPSMRRSPRLLRGPSLRSCSAASSPTSPSRRWTRSWRRTPVAYCRSWTRPRR